MDILRHIVYLGEMDSVREKRKRCPKTIWISAADLKEIVGLMGMCLIFRDS